MTGTYAARTAVPVPRSRDEIERTLQRYGADQFLYGSSQDRAVIGFRLDGRMVRLEVPLPIDDGHTVAKREQLIRQRWRALALVVKAKLEAVAIGLSSIEDEFLAGILLPDGSTFGDWARPQLESAYSSGAMPALLPGGRSE